MADSVSPTAGSSSTTKISPRDKPFLDIFQSHIASKAELGHLATTIPSRRHKGAERTTFLRYGSSPKGDRVRRGLRNLCFAWLYYMWLWKQGKFGMSAVSR